MTVWKAVQKMAPSKNMAIIGSSAGGGLTLAMVLKDAPGKYAMVKGIGADNWAGIAARKEDTEIVSFLNAELARLKADGSIYRLQEKWFGFRMTLADKVPSFS